MGKAWYFAMHSSGLSKNKLLKRLIFMNTQGGFLSPLYVVSVLDGRESVNNTQGY